MEIQINSCNVSNSWAFEGASISNPKVLTFSLHLTLPYEFSMKQLIAS